MKKGSNRTKEMDDKQKATKHKKFCTQLNWEIVKDKLDLIFDDGNIDQRNNIFLTFREFKQFLEQGETIDNLNKKNYSKHLLSFFVYVLKNKLPLTKEMFEKEYIENGYILNEIAKKYNIPKDHLRYLRQYFGVEKIGGRYSLRKKTQVALTLRQKELIYGSMMGDAKRQSTRKDEGAIGFKHSIKQKEYILWKFNELSNFSSLNTLSEEKYYHKLRKKTYKTVQFYTKSNDDAIEIIKEFYKTGKKEITQSILDNLTPFSIAVWFMDDGMTDMGYRPGKIIQHNCVPVPTFCTHSFSKESCELIVKWFLEKYNIQTKLVECQLKERKGYMVRVLKTSVEDFFNLIRPHILPMFLYKIDKQEYFKKRGLTCLFL